MELTRRTFVLVAAAAAISPALPKLEPLGDVFVGVDAASGYDEYTVVSLEYTPAHIFRVLATRVIEKEPGVSLKEQIEFELRDAFAVAGDTIRIMR